MTTRLLASTICLVVIQAICTVLFVASRRISIIKFMWSDVYVAVSWLSSIGLCVCALLGVRWGMGTTLEAESSKHQQRLAILLFVSLPNVYAVAVTFPKLAVLDFYLHIFIDRFSRVTSYTLATILVASMIGNLTATLVLSRPYEALLDLGPGKKYSSIHDHLTWGSFPNIVTDVAMLSLPIPILMKLHMRWRQKAEVLFMFTIGNSGLVISTIRFVFYITNFRKGFPEQIRTDIDSVIWCIAEAGAYHMAACFLTYGPLISLLASKRPFSLLLSSTVSLLRRSPDTCDIGSIKKSEEGLDHVLDNESTGGGPVLGPTGSGETRVTIDCGNYSMDEREKQAYVEHD